MLHGDQPVKGSKNELDERFYFLNVWAIPRRCTPQLVYIRTIEQRAYIFYAYIYISIYLYMLVVGYISQHKRIYIYASCSANKLQMLE